ncbi:MAG: hypothetical protein AB7K09_13650 [Planctomycetota bacterium]
MNTHRRTPPPLPPPPDDPQAAAADRLVDQLLGRALGDATSSPGLAGRILEALAAEMMTDDDEADFADADPHTPTETPDMNRSRHLSRTSRTPMRDRRKAQRNPDGASAWWLISATAATLAVAATIALAVWSQGNIDTPPNPTPDNPPSVHPAGDGDGAPKPVEPMFPEPERTSGAKLSWMIPPVFSADGKFVAVCRQSDAMLVIAPVSAFLEAGDGLAALPGAQKWHFNDARGPMLPGRQQADPQPHAMFCKAGLLSATPEDGLVFINTATRAITPLLDGTNQILSVSPDGMKVLVLHGSTRFVLHLAANGSVDKKVDCTTLEVPVETPVWSSNSNELFGTIANPPNVDDRSGQLRYRIFRQDVATGKYTWVMDGADIVAACAGDDKTLRIKPIRVTAVYGSGDTARLQVVAQERNWYDDPAHQGMSGTHTYGRAPRGSNPGSAEPGPPPPSWEFLVEGGKATLLQKRHLARYIDEILVLPSHDLTRFAFFQIAQFGGAGNARDPKVWVGSIDATGKKTESELKAEAFPAEWHNLHFQPIDHSDDGKLLMFVTGTVTLDRPGWDGPQGAMQAMRAGYTISQMWSDSTGSHVATPVFGLFRVDGATGSVTRVCGYGEKVPELDGKVTTVAGAAVNGAQWVPGSGTLFTRVVAGGGMFGRNGRESLLLINAADWRTR